MRIIISSLAAASALTLCTAGASAACFSGHGATAGTAVEEQNVAMSTHAGETVIGFDTATEPAAAAAEPCPDGEQACGPGTDGEVQR